MKLYYRFWYFLDLKKICNAVWRVFYVGHHQKILLKRLPHKAAVLTIFYKVFGESRKSQQRGTISEIPAKAVNDLLTLLFKSVILIGQTDFRTSKMLLRCNSNQCSNVEQSKFSPKLGRYLDLIEKYARSISVCCETHFWTQISKTRVLSVLLYLNTLVKQGLFGSIRYFHSRIFQVRICQYY